MTTAKEIYSNVLEDAGNNFQSAIDALLDGQYLEAAGYTDEDQAAIEEAFCMLKGQLAVNQNKK